MQRFFFALIFCASFAARGEGIDFEVSFFKSGPIIHRQFNTVTGPADGLRLFTGTRLVPSGEDGVWMGIESGGPVRVTQLGNASYEGGDFPAVRDWPMGIAFDSKANGAVLVTLSGEGGLYRREAVSGRWSLQASMQNIDLDSLVYNEADNTFWGLAVNFGGPGPTRVLQYSAQGQKLDEITLPPLPFSLSPGIFRSQLVMSGKLIIAMIETPNQGPIGPSDLSRIYVIDLEAKTMELTYEGNLDQPPQVSFTSPLVNARLPLGGTLHVKIAVSDPDKDLESIELRDGDALLKKWTFDPSPTEAQNLEFDYVPTRTGSHSLIAKATDRSGHVSEAFARPVVGDGPEDDPFKVSFVGWYWKNDELISVDYAAKGPLDGGSLFRGVPVAQAGYRYLGRDGHTVFRVDNEHDRYTETEPPGNLPELSWPRGTTYDSERNRFLVVSLGGEGYLYAVTPSSLEWSVVASMDNVDVDSIVYHPGDDHLYMVENLHDGGIVRVLRYTSDGRKVGTIVIPAVPLDIGGYYQSRLISTGDKIALLIEPTPGWQPNPPVESRIYIINPERETSVLTYWKRWQTWPPEPPTGIVVTRDLPDSYTAGGWIDIRLQVVPAGIGAWAVEEQAPAGWVMGQASHEGTFDAATGKIKWGPFTTAQPQTLFYNLRAPGGATGSKSFSGIVSMNGASKPIVGDTTIMDKIPYHPADEPPQDYRITANELTAYASAWRNQTEWPRSPSPIPVSYVTRAGLIWKSGEQYSFSAGTPAPNCWVPLSQDTKGGPGIFTAQAVGAGEAARTLTSSTQADDSVTVSVRIRPGAGVRSYALEEHPPRGCNIVDAEGVSMGNGVIRFGPFFDAQERTLVYRVTPKDGAIGAFSGEVSFDGSSERVGGDATIASSGVRAQQLDGRLYLRFSASPAQRFVFETAESLDSASWKSEAILDGSGSAIELPAIDPSGSQKFYRLRPLPIAPPAATE